MSCFVKWLIKKHSKNKIILDQVFILIQSYPWPLLELHNRWRLGEILNVLSSLLTIQYKLISVIVLLPKKKPEDEQKWNCYFDVSIKDEKGAKALEIDSYYWNT